MGYCILGACALLGALLLACGQPKEVLPVAYYGSRAKLGNMHLFLGTGGEAILTWCEISGGHFGTWKRRGTVDWAAGHLVLEGYWGKSLVIPITRLPRDRVRILDEGHEPWVLLRSKNLDSGCDKLAELVK